MGLNPQKSAALAAEALKALIEALQQQREQLDQKIIEAQEALKFQQRQSASASTRQQPSARRKKGEVLVRLRELFNTERDLALTVTEISGRLEIPPSSLQNVLRKQALEFIQQPDGRWKRKGLAA